MENKRFLLALDRIICLICSLYVRMQDGPGDRYEENGETDRMMEQTTTQLGNPRDGEDLPSPPPAAASLAVDWRDYDDLLAGNGMSDEQKAEFVESLWSIAVSFVDLSLGLHPAQLATGDHDIEQVMQRLLDEWMKEEDMHE